LEQQGLEAITFSSGKTVSHTCQMLEAAYGPQWQEKLRGIAVVSIGPQTSQRCHQLLGRVDAEANPHDLEGLVEACAAALRDPPSPVPILDAG
jgi:uroporphyrinogen-III synthase